MKNNKHCKRESQQAHQFNANPIQFILGLCVILGVSSISVRAADNPAQAAARVALEQKMYELDHALTPPVVSVIRSKAVVGQPGKSAANVTATVSKKAVTPQPALAPTTPATASTAVAPAAVVLTAVAPAAVAPHRLILMLACFMVCFILSLLLLKLLLRKVLLQNSRSCSSNQDSTSSGAYNAQANPFTLRLKTGDR
jgi:hypothetical protein